MDDPVHELFNSHHWRMLGMFECVQLGGGHMADYDGGVVLYNKFGLRTLWDLPRGAGGNDQGSGHFA